jgi:2-haloacid dehalogenase
MHDTVIFDLGGVLIDWNPRHLYRKLFAGDEAAMEHFLAHVCTSEWHARHDAGERFVDTRGELKARFPHHAALIDAFGDRHDEMFAGPIAPSVALLERLAARGTKLYALTNFPPDSFPIAKARFAFLSRFRDIVVSGHERVMKPDPRIYRILIERNGIDARKAVYIDDNATNAEAARALGMHGIHFRDAAALEAELTRLGLLERA